MSVIDDYLEKLEENRKVRVPNEYFTTDICKPCMRNVYYGITCDVPKAKDSRRVLITGTILEDFYLDVLANTPGVRVIATQVPARYFNKERGYEIHGRIDALCYHEGQGLVAHEIKSAKTASWKKAANDDHLLQLQFYLNTTGLVNGVIDVIDKTIMLHGKDPRNEDIDIPPDTHYPIVADPGVLAGMIKAADALHYYVSNKILPPKTPCFLCWGKVAYCDYIDQCGADSLNEGTQTNTAG